MSIALEKDSAAAKESATERLTSLLASPKRFEIPYAELLPLQLEAADEVFQDRVHKIKLLANRADTAGISGINKLADIVPLLFAHTAYKSYPEGWLLEQKWDRLGKWLDTVSATRVPKVDLENVADIDDWLGRLAAAGHYVSCSSGTTGKCSMMPATKEDLDWASRDGILAVTWASGIEPLQQFKMIGGGGAVASSPRNDSMGGALHNAFNIAGWKQSDKPPARITIGGITGMVALRKSIADGTAKPADIARYEAISAERQAQMDHGVGEVADALIANRKDPIFIMGMYALLYKLAEEVRSRGYSGKDFNPENATYIGGGLKGNVLPPDYREFIFGTFNLNPPRVYQMYGMQELGSSMPRCSAGRYHVPAWMIVLQLDEHGDNLVEPGQGEIEGRAAYFDLSLKGRWNGVISGDKIKVDYGTCACGHAGPTVNNNIVRYSEMAGGDKITCSGTIDAYVRGVS